MSEKSVSLYETKPYDDMFFTSKYSQRGSSNRYGHDTARTDATRIYPTPDNKYHWEHRSVWDLDEKDLLIPGEQRRRKIVPGISILPGTDIDTDTLDILKNDENPEYKPLRPFSQESPVSWDLTRAPRPEQSYRTLLAEISKGTSEYPSMQSGSTPGTIPISDIQREDKNGDLKSPSDVLSKPETKIISQENNLLSSIHTGSEAFSNLSNPLESFSKYVTSDKKNNPHAYNDVRNNNFLKQFNTPSMKELSKLAKKAGWGADIVSGLTDIYNAYINNEDVKRTIAKVAGNLGGAAVGSLITGLTAGFGLPLTIASSLVVNGILSNLGEDVMTNVYDQVKK
ncbi:MAG: hypothetical protein IJY36_02555 [Coprobacter sp.]|nr:hypothetical protein [Coprobacter sp.]